MRTLYKLIIAIAILFVSIECGNLIKGSGFYVFITLIILAVVISLYYFNL